MPPRDSTPGATAPVRVALAPDAPVVMAGLEAMLVADDAGLMVVDLPHRAHDDDVDLVVYDPEIGLPGGLGAGPGRQRPVLVAFSWSMRETTATQARHEGASALLSKDLPAHRLLATLRALHDGRPVSFVVAAEGPASGPDVTDFRPGGLTSREFEIIELICAGHSNYEIAEMLFVSINTVKTYIRSAYRRIGVTRRSQAVLWGVHSGIVKPEHGR